MPTHTHTHPTYTHLSQTHTYLLHTHTKLSHIHTLIAHTHTIPDTFIHLLNTHSHLSQTHSYSHCTHTNIQVLTPVSTVHRHHINKSTCIRTFSDTRICKHRHTLTPSPDTYAQARRVQREHTHIFFITSSNTVFSFGLEFNVVFCLFFTLPLSFPSIYSSCENLFHISSVTPADR